MLLYHALVQVLKLFLPVYPLEDIFSAEYPLHQHKTEKKVKKKWQWLSEFKIAQGENCYCKKVWLGFLL